GGTVNITPLKLTELLDCRSPGTLAGTGPAPLSMVNDTSVAFVVVMRLVTATLRKTDRFSVIVVPGAPEQVRSMSPRISEIPSARTGGLTAPVEQLKGTG